MHLNVLEWSGEELLAPLSTGPGVSSDLHSVFGHGCRLCALEYTLRDQTSAAQSPVEKPRTALGSAFHQDLGGDIQNETGGEH